MTITRRDFLQLTTVASLGFTGLGRLIASIDQGITRAPFTGYGPLTPDPEGILSMPEGFRYRIISRWGEIMDDGLKLPNRADGMAAFAGGDGRVILVRNHEVDLNVASGSAFGEDNELLRKLRPEQLYDYGHGTQPSLGGTTTLVYNEETGEVERQFMSLAGTNTNCAGGMTPWGSWVSCEENVTRAGAGGEKDHGFNFEVPALADGGLVDPVPLTEMGRFNHEAICVDPVSGVVYETEDRGDGLFYRFIPNRPGNLAAGGRLQALAIQGDPRRDTRNWPDQNHRVFPVGEPVVATWIDLDNVEAPEDDLRYRGREIGAALFTRGEGLWFGKGELYFVCTDGGANQRGQIFRYIPSPYEGTTKEKEQPGKLELFAEPNSTDLLRNGDNLTVTPWGDLMLCEDTRNPRLIGITAGRQPYTFADNVGYPKSEFAGACFSPSGKTMFVSMQHVGLTFAITGPWMPPLEVRY